MHFIKKYTCIKININNIDNKIFHYAISKITLLPFSM